MNMKSKLEDVKLSPIRDLNYPITAMGQASTYSSFPIHRHVTNNGKIRAQLLAARAIIEYTPSSELADLFRKLAWNIYENSHVSKPKSLNADEMSALASIIGDRARELHSGNIL